MVWFECVRVWTVNVWCWSEVHLLLNVLAVYAVSTEMSNDTITCKYSNICTIKKRSAIYSLSWVLQIIHINWQQWHITFICLQKWKLASEVHHPSLCPATSTFVFFRTTLPNHLSVMYIYIYKFSHTTVKLKTVSQNSRTFYCCYFWACFYLHLSFSTFFPSPKLFPPQLVCKGSGQVRTSMWSWFKDYLFLPQWEDVEENERNWQHAQKQQENNSGMWGTGLQLHISTCTWYRFCFC